MLNQQFQEHGHFRRIETLQRPFRLIIVAFYLMMMTMMWTKTRKAPKLHVCRYGRSLPMRNTNYSIFLPRTPKIEIKWYVNHARRNNRLNVFSSSYFWSKHQNEEELVFAVETLLEKENLVIFRAFSLSSYNQPSILEDLIDLFI